MLKTLNWIERSFNFDFPAEIFPTIIQRLRGTPVRLEEILNTIPESLLRKKMNNKWSILEHAGHLIELEALGEKRLKEFLAGKEILTAADMTNKKTEETDYNSKTKDEILSQFRKERINFIQKLEDLSLEQVSLISFHPRLKQNLRLVDWIYFIAEHDDHHLAKIYEIYKEIV